MCSNTMCNLILCAALSLFLADLILANKQASGIGHELSEADKKKVSLAMDLLEEELPVSGLTMDEILDLVLARYKEKLKKIQEPRMLSSLAESTATSERNSRRKIGEICGTSASLECGKKVLASLEEEMETTTPSISLSLRCLVRKEFLQCIELHRRTCRQLAEKGIVPQLPTEEIIKNTQSRIWRALWTSGGCTLAN